MPRILSHNNIHPKIAADAWIAPGATVIGDVEIGSKSSIWFGCTVRGDMNVIRIGKNSNLQDNSVIHVAYGKFGTYIGDDVLMGHMCLIHACTIEDGVTIGMRACVMDGAVIERGAMVAAGALVTPGKVVPSGELWVGSPAKKMRDLSEDEMAANVSAAQRYADFAQRYRTELNKAAE
jgi:carbonic anhydrase/acetyltransferase-like protein (isoleucine patch superfamily)